MHLGRFLGNYLGRKTPEIINDLNLLGTSNLVEACWEQCFDHAVTHMFVNRSRVGAVSFGKSSGVYQLPNDDRHSVHVIDSGPLNADEPEEILRCFIEKDIENKVELTWTPPIDDSDVSFYRVRSNDGVGVTFTKLEATVGRNDFRYVTRELAPGTWMFCVHPVDDNGNELTSSLAVSIVVPTIVEPPTEPVSFTLLPDGAPPGSDAKITWSPSPTAGVTYKVYSNGGSGKPDFTAPWATTASLMATGPVVAGDWIFIIRAELAGDESDNFDIRIEVQLQDFGSDLRLVGGLPNPVKSFQVTPLIGGLLRIDVVYDTHEEQTKGAFVNIYGELLVDPLEPTFALPPDIALAIPLHDIGQGGPFELTATIGPLAEETWQFVARVEDTFGFEEKSDPLVIVDNDATPPDDITSLTAVLV